MTLQRRNLMVTAAATAAAAAGLAAPRLVRAQGDAWPDRPLRLVVPWPPGGSTDIIARAFQPRLQEALGRPVAVENRPGMAGAAGAKRRPAPPRRRHLAARLRHRGHQPDGAAPAALPHARGLRAGDPGGHRAARARGAPVRALRQLRRRGPGGPARARRRALRHQRGGRAGARRRHAAAAGRRLPHGARALPGRRPGGAGRGGRAGAAADVQRGRGARARPLRGAAAARGDHARGDAPPARRAPLRAAGHAGRLRGADLVGAARRRRHARAAAGADGRGGPGALAEPEVRPDRGARGGRGGVPAEECAAFLAARSSAGGGWCATTRSRPTSAAPQVRRGRRTTRPA
jgi:hypothetical protein